MTTANVQQSAQEASQYATFHVGDLLLGLPIHLVQEINRHLEVTSVPHAPNHVRGVINLRGEVVTVVNLAAILGLPVQDITCQTRNVIIHWHDQLIGLVVDQIADIQSIPPDKILPPPGNIRGVEGRFFRGVHAMDEDIIVLLSIQEALAVD